MTFIWLLFGIAIVTQAHVVKKLGDDEEGLEWPKIFSLKAERVSLTDNVVEKYQIWKTLKMSRIDYNEGYVKEIIRTTKPYRHRGIKYSIHPEAYATQEVYTVCNTLVGTWAESITPATILPEEEYSYTAVGKETIQDKNCSKFEYNSIESNTDKRRTIWASYDANLKKWIPVRYEVIQFNVWLGSKDMHEVWDFYDFDQSFSLEDVFDVKDYDCESEKTTYYNHGEAFKKNLHFVNPDKDEHIDNLFHSYKTEFARTYADENEHGMRRSVFKNNVRRVIETNRRNVGYKLAVNKFADRTPEEMTRYMGLNRRPEGKVGTVPFPYDEEKIKELSSELPTEYDARLLGLVSKVKNQEECGSCWTFGTTAAVEGALARINGGRLMALANQALVDCAWAFGAAGCNGGSDNAAYEWMMKYGLPTEAEYGPYLNQDGVCNIKNSTETYPIRGFTDVTPLSVGALKVALVNHGPLSVSVDVTTSFSLYSSGIYYDLKCTQTSLNHEITLVGYGERDGETFWIVKNSWGPTWGIDGYMYISSRDNNCGIATEPTYVVF